MERAGESKKKEKQKEKMSKAMKGEEFDGRVYYKRSGMWGR